ncbi:hypothetical protein ANN_24129 [Periplaneta americana]|uniref:Uncharacterized protein n=1 Tax=Periplaneta americana TaxID=6978 RepID=A0ABQ8S2X3_PERAM|nr:hypothetical protein ANN_24129 [Periplaneta americana]
MAGLCEGGNEPPGSLKASRRRTCGTGYVCACVSLPPSRSQPVRPLSDTYQSDKSFASLGRTERRPKGCFYEELEHTFDQLSRYHMKILLEDFNAKVGREDIFKPTIGKESLHVTSNDKGVRVQALNEIPIPKVGTRRIDLGSTVRVVIVAAHNRMRAQGSGSDALPE